MRLWQRVTGTKLNELNDTTFSPSHFFDDFYIVFMFWWSNPTLWGMCLASRMAGVTINNGARDCWLAKSDSTNNTLHCWQTGTMKRIQAFFGSVHGGWPQQKSQCERAMAAMTHRHEASTPSQICTRPHFLNRVASQVLRLSSFAFSRNACRMLQSSVVCLRVFRLFHASLLAVHSPPCQSVQGLLPSSQLRTWDFFELLQRLKCFLRI